MASSKAAICESESVPSVQELVKKQLTSVPERYIRLENHAKTSFSPEITLPAIDMKKLIHGEATEELEKLHSACAHWGFFQLVNHGINSKVLEKFKDEIEGFFKLPFQEKMKFKVRPGDVEGFGAVTISEDQKLDWSDRLFMITNPLHRRNQHLFQELPSSFRTILDSYVQEVQGVAMAVLSLLEKTLKIEEGEMVELFEDGVQSVRMTYYPACPEPEKVMGLTAHSDATGITILNEVNGVNGLEIKKDGVWIPVHVISDALVVNIGDVLEIMSNGAYKSAEHRATVNSETHRISTAVFLLPKIESEIGPLDCLTNPQNPPLFKKITTENYIKGFFSRKLDGKSYLQIRRIKKEMLAKEAV